MKVLLGIGLALVLLVPDLVLADVGPPAHMQITESEPGLYMVQWRVPRVLPPRGVPVPELPESWRPVSERRVTRQPAAWLFTREWRCDSGLAGQTIGMRYPFPDLALTTVVRVDLLSGDRFAHVLSPGDEPWRLPEGTAAPDLLRAARRAVLAGAAHVLGSGVHLIFLLVIALLGGYRPALHVVTAFTLGQLASVTAGALPGSPVPDIGAVPAEIGLAVGVVILARQALEPVGKRKRLGWVAVLAGAAHGLGIAAFMVGEAGAEAAGVPARLLTLLGMDAAHVVGGLGLTALVSFATRPPAAARVRRVVAYGTGATGVALAVSLALTGTGPDARALASSLSLSRDETSGPAAGPAGSRRVAPAAPDAAVQSFVAVEPFELRHEAMLRLDGLSGELGLDLASVLEIAEQPRLAEELAALVLASTTVRVDGQSPTARVRRVDFLTVDPTGALPRPTPVLEPVAAAVVGVVLVYPTASMPREITFGWERLPGGVTAVPATVIDPEAVTSHTLSAATPSLTWENNLLEDPLPTVAAVAVEPLELPLPWLGLPLAIAAVTLAIAGMRGRRPALDLAVARVVLALACVVGPLLQTAVAVPGLAGRTPTERQARRVLAGLLPNIYRALEFRDEATIYDRLAVSVTGETLRDVYLQQRRALEIAERGGAQARVEAVEVLAAEDIAPLAEGFGLRAAWTVGGMVTHYGHRHFRQNRYDARIEIVPVAGTWKIRSLEVLDQERIR